MKATASQKNRDRLVRTKLQTLPIILMARVWHRDVNTGTKKTSRIQNPGGHK